MESAPEENICKDELFNEVFETHSKDLFNFLYYKYGAGNNPHDVVQEAFIKLWNNCHKVIFDKARAFLFTVANNHMLSDLAKKKTALNFAETKPKSYSHETPEYLLEEKEYESKLETAIAELTEEQRVAFLLNRIEGKKHQEIADMLGISRKAVEKRIYTALAKLREKVENI
ncbi:MAG: RNA polymerase subunit sigma-70 [Bacteroidetes bacterium]|nr:MAG: RNA polymerase subunit sigma-70 [Bacteroidota bacterium]